MKRIAQAVFNRTLIFRVFHVDEVDHDQTAQVTQTQLTRDFVGGLLVGAYRCFFDVGASGGARRVDVNSDEGLGMVDHDRAAGRQFNRARVGGFDLVFDLEAREQRDIVAVAFDALDVVRHHDTHKGRRLIGDIVRIDQNLTDIG